MLFLFVAIEENDLFFRSTMKVHKDVGFDMKYKGWARLEEVNGGGGGKGIYVILSNK